MRKQRDNIAVIGMSGRFPGARNIDEFWSNLRGGVQSISSFSASELAESGIDASVLENSAYVPAGSILSDIELFDAAFFGFSPREAESLDPQQRIFLETSWHALEDAGYEPESYSGSIGVYAGCAISSYLDYLHSNPEFLALLGYLQVYIGNEKDYLATRVSYKLNLRGPSFNVQTACSTSLLAVAVACDALVSRQCDMALAGGVCVRVPQKAGYYFETGGIFSPDGHCRVFDERAQGVVFGNGVGVVVLKRLADALADGDTIDAVVKGWAVNNDGAAKASFTAPGLRGQAEVIVRAMQKADVRSESISYVEAHGTGTTVGDPIEIAALTQAFRTHTKKKNFCGVGSVKTNVGHLDPAAGVASLIKTVLALQHKELPASLNCDTPNTRIDFANSPFYVNTSLSPWLTSKGPRRAGVSAFGIGGTNVHVILEEAPAAKPPTGATVPQLLVLSARSNSAVEAMAADLVDHVYRHPDLAPADIAFTCQVGRKAFNHRWALVYHDANDLLETLMAKDPKRVLMSADLPSHRPIAFMFSGQGSQYRGMASGIYDVEPVFRECIDECTTLLKPRIGLDLRELLYGDGEQDAASGSPLNETWITQPALFATEYALAKLWMKWGIRPDALIGHSVGEYVAACLAGVFALEDAIALIAERGRLMQELPPGSMLAVALPEAEVRPLLHGDIDLAATNEPSSCVVSGPTPAIAELQSTLAAGGLNCRLLHTSHAFHSKMMEPAVRAFAARVAEVTMRRPEIPWISNVTGDWINASDAVDPEYWARHIRQPVRFSEGLRRLLQEPDRIFLEVGPGQSLSTFARRQPERSARHLVLSSVRHPQDTQADMVFLLNSLGRLWLSGATVNWTGMQAGGHGRRIHLPGYRFERRRYWAGLPEAEDAVAPTILKQPDLAEWFYVPSWAYAPAPERDEAPKGPECWLIFLDDLGIGEQVVEQLRGDGSEVITVRRSQEYSNAGRCEFRLDPRQSLHYAALLNELRNSRRLPQKVLHLWNISSVDETLAGPALFDACQDVGFYSLIHLAQALARARISDAVEIGMVSSNMHLVSGRERICPARSALIGACKSISQEYPNMLCRSIDVDLKDLRQRTREGLARHLIAELAEDRPDPVVAYRGGQRWVQVFEPFWLDQAEEFDSIVRQDGVYLITGGLGGIGLVLAEHLAASCRAKLVLLGRSRFPARQDWHTWLRTNRPEDPTSIRIRRLLEIEKLGSDVLVISADVADPGQMHNAIERLYARFTRLDGVIHAAGNVTAEGFFAIDQADRALCEQQFHSKVRGLMVLEELLSDRDLDFVVLFSSISSVLAGLGYVAYAAANAFMDAVAHKNSQFGRVPWISINWDTWDLRSGPAAETEPENLAMNADEGVDAFRRILDSGVMPAIVVSTGDLGARIDQWVNLRSLRMARRARESQTAGGHSRPELANPYVAPRSSLEEAIVEVWQDILGVSQVGVTDDFFTDLSGSSLLATQLVAQLRSRFQVELPLRRLFEGPTVAELAVTIDSQRENASRSAPLEAMRADRAV